MPMPGPHWGHVLAGLFTAAHFLLLTVQLYWLSLVPGVLAVASVIWWVWGLDKGEDHPPQDVGGGVRIPVYVQGPRNHAARGTSNPRFGRYSTLAGRCGSIAFLSRYLPSPWRTFQVDGSEAGGHAATVRRSLLSALRSL